VADSRTLKLLLVEDDLEDEQLLSEAILEIEEQRRWCTWRTSTIVHVEQLADALDCLRQEWFDVILLNLSLPDSRAVLDSFFEANAAARGAPIVILADEEDENLARRLLREGAQDVLLKSELDCAPLARSLRYAIERQLRTKALRSSPFIDDLTGTLTHQSFLTIASHYERLSCQSGIPLVMAWLEISELFENTQEDREARELVLIRAAEVLRGAFESPALVGRIGRLRFGVITSGFTATTTETLLHAAAREIETTAWSGRQPATVRFSLTPLDSETTVEDLLGDDGDDLPLASHRRAKTVMLAD